MDKQISLLPLLIVSILLSSQQILASHGVGVNISYCNVGNNQWKITVREFASCTGGNSHQNITIHSRCSQTTTTQTHIINKKPFVATPGLRPGFNGGEDVSEVCDSYTTCLLHMQTFEGIITLPPCNSYEVWYDWTWCCNGSTYTNTTSNQSRYYCRFNSQDFPSNCAPQFADEKKVLIGHNCTGISGHHFVGASDGDGDSLRYELTPVIKNNGTLATYNAGYSYGNPMQIFSMNPITGAITSRSSVQGTFLIAYEVKEFERCGPRKGQLKGLTYRESVIGVSNCSGLTNRKPEDISGISNLYGPVSLVSSAAYTLEACNNEIIGWDDTLHDPDGDTIHFTTNAHQILPGITVQHISISKSTTVVRYRWKTDINIGEFASFHLDFRDNQCNTTASNRLVYHIRIKPSAYAGPDITVCRGDTASLSASGGTSFVWRSISGDPLIVGVNLFHSTSGYVGQNIRFKPTQTTTLEVMSNLTSPCSGILGANCSSTDTIVITPADSFSLNIVPDMQVCTPASGQLDVFPSQSSLAYTYDWSPSTNLSQPKIKNPSFTNLDTSRIYTIRVSSQQGCVREKSIRIDAVAKFPDSLKLATPYTQICLQDTVSMYLEASINRQLYNFSWIAAGNNSGLMGATNMDTAHAIISGQTDSIYKLIVSNKQYGFCRDTLLVNFSIHLKYNVTPNTPSAGCIDRGFIQLTAPTAYNITKPGGRWSGVGIVDDALGIWNPLVSGVGSFVVKYRITGNSCANEDSTILQISSYPDASVLGPEKICGYSREIITAKTSGGKFSGTGIDSSMIGGTMHYYLDGPSFARARTLPDTAVIRHIVHNGCTTDTLIKIQVVAPKDSSYLGIKWAGRNEHILEFCDGGPGDTLVSAGHSSVWSSPSHPGIITSDGYFSPSVSSVQTPSGHIEYITIRTEDTTFCGTTNTFQVQVLEPPYFEILQKSICIRPGGCDNLSLSEQFDTLKLRYPVFGNFTAFDTMTHISPTNAPKWNISPLSGVTFWAGTPALPTSSSALFRLRWCNLQAGQYPVYYQVGTEINHPIGVCVRRDTMIVQVSNPCYLSDSPDPKLAQINVYPNPFKNHIEILGLKAMRNVALSLHDIHGRELMHHTIPTGTDTYTLHIDNLASGMYLLKATSNGQVRVFRVVRE
jgi:hypothetical protein